MGNRFATRVIKVGRFIKNPIKHREQKRDSKRCGTFSQVISLPLDIKVSQLRL